MTHLKTSVVAGVGFLALASIGLLINRKDASAQPPPPAQQVSLVRDVDARSEQPFQGTFFVNIANGSFSASMSAFTVPASKRLVIETAAFQAQLPADQAVVITGINASIDNQQALMPIVVQEQGTIPTTAGVRHNFAGSQPVWVKAGPGTQVQLSWTRSSSSGAVAGVFTLTGYETDAP